MLPPTAPPWKPTWSLGRSTLSMVIHRGGWSSPTHGAEFGIISYDWSNAKAQWAMQQPMDCQERLLQQAQMTKNANPSSHVFVYRNLVKALPWFSSVRKILNDPAYSGFFLRFDSSQPAFHVPACAAENASKCSEFYHDQLQTPEVPTEQKPHPDGTCPPASDGGCDCGVHPCGEYLWDHRNGSQLREWLISEHILGPDGIGSPAIDGLFIDDYWCSDLICDMDPSIAGCPCGDPVQGPTEVERHNQADMGLTDADILDLTRAWNQTMGQAQQAILDAGAYTWSLMHGQHNANAMPALLAKASCAQQLREACAGGPELKTWQEQARLVGVVLNGGGFAQLAQDIAFFLLARGPYAWLGWGTWGMCWPLLDDNGSGGVPRPAVLEEDFGEPIDKTCWERPDEPGVFVRHWTAGLVELNCNTFEAKLPAGVSHTEDFVVE